MPQIWTRWLQVKRIQSGTPDHNPIPATAHKTPLLEHQPNLFNSTLIRCYCRQLDFYTGEDNHMGCECPAMDSSPGKNVQFTYRLQACSESVKRAGYYRELTVPGIRPFLLYSRPNIGSFAYHFQVVILSLVVTPGRHSLPIGGHASVWIAGKTLTCLEYPGDARPIVLLP